VFNYAVHLAKDGVAFVLLDDTASLTADGRWTKQAAVNFLKLVNDFYRDTDFAAYYEEHIPFYEAETKRFVEDTYAAIDMKWFGSYVDPGNLRCVYSPASSRNNYGATVNERIVYAAVSGSGAALVHEFCHSFAKPIAEEWYSENEEFKQFCDETVNPERLPTYPSGIIIAGEYITRAYNTLYYAEHGVEPLLTLLQEKGQGFPYIEDVYALITPYEKIAWSDDKIADIFKSGYELGPQREISLNGRTINWQIVTVEGFNLEAFSQTEVGNVFGSSFGEIVYYREGVVEALLIDLGETVYQGRDGYRKYCRIPLT
jgi:hypothetical protein